MKLKNKILTLIVMIFAICMMLMPSNVHAALQANGSNPSAYSLPTWITTIRQMEAIGGTLGLTDTIDETSLVSSATTSNNLDIHMEKNTEYGAMAILSASAYGNQNVIANGETTTGNKTGVYINFNKEWVAAGTLKSCSEYFNANSKYKNLYTRNYKAIAGDAIEEVTIGNISDWGTKTWHSSGNESSRWYLDNDQSGLIRAYDATGGIFSYYAYQHASTSSSAHYSYGRHTRAVIVLGEGF